MTSGATKLAPEHISFAVQALLSFAHAAVGSKTLSSDKVQELNQKSSTLLDKIQEGKIDPTKACIEVKKIIQEINANLPKGHAPYPTIASDVLEKQVKNNVIAFEFFLNHKLKTNELTLEQESPLFSDSLILWRDVGEKLTAREGMHQLLRLIAKANSYLSEDKRFPIPDPAKYQ